MEENKNDLMNKAFKLVERLKEASLMKDQKEIENIKGELNKLEKEAKQKAITDNHFNEDQLKIVDSIFKNSVEISKEFFKFTETTTLNNTMTDREKIKATINLILTCLEGILSRFKNEAKIKFLNILLEKIQEDRIKDIENYNNDAEKLNYIG